ncbi:MAG: hypothetical protein AUK47_22740 [Deltaproteobacteria bacterium CG2_30_63_29]|nr:MAG: hypothetical protein AUK47_22740 [Deltaproteobacteria bacterium CG2_30_63_29]PJB47947.1 MAG: hypothetical protein CO108_03280 [Deltaproteobacteria bacterium CG_4_9_14_3_um_filter_63_12]
MHGTPRKNLNTLIGWLLVAGVVVPTIGAASVGIIIVSLWRVGGDIALGVLTIVFGALSATGSTVALVLLRQKARVEKQQSDFIANVSHELRTPLSSVKMYTETLKLGRFRNDEDFAHCLDAIERESEHLSVLIESLLDFGALKVAEARVEIEPAEVLANVLNGLPQIDSSRVSTVLEPHLPPLITSRKGLGVALSNLVRNADIHGGPGPIVITVRADRDGIGFEVRDEGPGLSRAEQSRVFNRFERGDLARTNARPGMGLGLSIVRGFADEHHGDVTVRSSPGKGSAFVLWLPSTEAMPSAPKKGNRP